MIIHQKLSFLALFEPKCIKKSKTYPKNLIVFLEQQNNVIDKFIVD